MALSYIDYRYAAERRAVNVFAEEHEPPIPCSASTSDRQKYRYTSACTLKLSQFTSKSKFSDAEHKDVSRSTSHPFVFGGGPSSRARTHDLTSLPHRSNRNDLVPAYGMYSEVGAPKFERLSILLYYHHYRRSSIYCTASASMHQASTYTTLHYSLSLFKLNRPFSFPFRHVLLPVSLAQLKGVQLDLTDTLCVSTGVRVRTFQQIPILTPNTS